MWDQLFWSLPALVVAFLLGQAFEQWRWRDAIRAWIRAGEKAARDAANSSKEWP